MVAKSSRALTAFRPTVVACDVAVSTRPTFIAVLS